MEMFNKTHPRLELLKNKLKLLSDKYPELYGTMTQVPMYVGNKSYTIDKKTIFICIHDLKKEKENFSKERKSYYYSDNVLMYVILHELAHFLNKKDYGHTDEWRRVFMLILKHAEEVNIYDSKGEQPPSDYCKGDEEHFTLF